MRRLTTRRPGRHEVSIRKGTEQKTFLLSRWCAGGGGGGGGGGDDDGGYERKM